MEWLSSGDKALGLLIATIGLLGGLGRWFWGRVSKRVSEGVSGLTVGHNDITRRLAAVEGDVKGLHDDMRRVEKQMSGVEHRLHSLASKQDLNALAITLAKVEATGDATSQKVDSLYRGVLARAERDTK